MIETINKIKELIDWFKSQPELDPYQQSARSKKINIDNIFHLVFSRYHSEIDASVGIRKTNKVEVGDIFLTDNYLILIVSYQQDSFHDAQCYWKLQLNLSDFKVSFKREQHTEFDTKYDIESRQIKPPFMCVAKIDSFHNNAEKLTRKLYDGFDINHKAVENIEKFLRLINMLPILLEDYHEDKTVKKENYQESETMDEYI